MPEPGDLMLIRGAGVFERAVEWATSSPYGHVAMFVQPGQIVEAKDFRGVQLNKISAYPNHKWYRVACEPEQRAKAVGWALKRLGQPYGWAEAAHDWNRPLVGLELVKRTHLRPVDCSGLCVWSYRQVGVLLTRRPAPTPADLSWSVALQPMEEP